MIANGTATQNVPYNAQIIYLNAQGAGFFGGGSLISSQHVLTVAHIIVGFTTWRVGLGSNNLNQIQRWNSTTAVSHPSYDANTRNNDIGFITLPTPIQFTANIQPISLPDLNRQLPYANEQGWIVGFGWTDPAGLETNFLQATFKRVTNDTRCTQTFNQAVVTNHFCTFDETHSTNICFGDLGAGFVTNYRGIATLVGMASQTVAACSAVQPSLFIRVSPYREWLRNIIQV